ncbi:MAG: DUF1080 domain-containing protein [Planctomycetaceae bacterium]|nr:DUF1080 domain-containing protein [Planctomycetaceae bacterium]
MLRAMWQPITAAVLLAVPMLSAVPASAEQAEKGFQPIFNGKDLTGWQGEPGRWSVEDGAITGVTAPDNPLKKASYLFWRGGKPADFVLRASFRFVSPAGNSGINFRSQELPGGDIKGYQADMETGPDWTGGLYECNQREVVARRGQKVVIAEDGKRDVSELGDGAKLLKLIKPHDWNRCEIIARGPEITIKINGTVMTQVIDREKGKAAASGLISLQVHPGPPMKVQFKDIRIKTR